MFLGVCILFFENIITRQFKKKTILVKTFYGLGVFRPRKSIRLFKRGKVQMKITWLRVKLRVRENTSLVVSVYLILLPGAPDALIHSTRSVHQSSGLWFVESCSRPQ